MRIAAAVKDFLVRHPGYRRRPLLGYGAAVLFVTMAVLARVVAGGAIVNAPFITVFPAVMAAAFVGGRGPGLLAAVLGGVAAEYMVDIRPQPAAIAGSGPHLVTFVLYLVVASLLALVVDWLIKIAEQNAALALRTEQLLTELQHRVKNHIQIVSSLLNLQARRATGESAAALNDAARRINTISSAYAHIYHADLALDFAHHLHDIADAALGMGRATRQVEVIAEPVEWGMDYVMPLSLIASELIENALRHGLREAGGRVEVRLGRHGEGYRLRVSNPGDTLPPGFDPARDGGLGLQLVAAMGKRIRAALSIERGSDTAFILDFQA